MKDLKKLKIGIDIGILKKSGTGVLYSLKSPVLAQKLSWNLAHGAPRARTETRVVQPALAGENLRLWKYSTLKFLKTT